MNDKAAHRSSKAASQWRWQIATAGVLLALVTSVALGEWFGWPFLAEPLQRLLSDTLVRRVRFSADAEPHASNSNAFQVRFVGGLRLLTPQLEIAAPAWSSAPHLLLARDVALDLRYADLWRAYQGQPLRIQRLQAAMLDAYLERLVDGRASWQFGQNPESMALPSFGSLQVASGTLHYRDMPLAADIEARFSVVDGALQAVAHQVTTGSKAVALDQSASVMQPASVLQVNASGYYRKLPLKMELVSSGRLTSSDDTAPAAPVAVTLNATLGRATLAFKGSATSALYPSGFSGRFSLNGPSLGAVGELIGVTLPTTAEFQTDGVIDKQGGTSRVRIDDATVGSSRLNGAFTYEKNRSVPLLSGQLGGARLLLADLGPALGTMPAGASTLDKGKIRGKGMVLPDRQYDLPALRNMDADVLIDISHVDLNTSFLEPLRPLHGHLQLKAGVLTLQDIDARTAQGQLKGDLRLDGRDSKALWNTNLRWDGVRLERWIHQARAEGSPPFVSGRMSGRATLQGQGRSTAEILANLKGHVRTELHDGAMSHLAVEVAGLNLGESLGILIKGDDVLPVQCAVADLVAEGGVLRPRVMVLDTEDSTIWVVGSLSLATEKLDLRAVVSPKSFSLLSLRAPLRVRGSFASPQVSLDKRPMGLKLAASFLLALVNPLAAFIPLSDSGDADEAKRAAALCQGVMQRGQAKPAATAR